MSRNPENFSCGSVALNISKNYFAFLIGQEDRTVIQAFKGHACSLLVMKTTDNQGGGLYWGCFNLKT